MKKTREVFAEQTEEEERAVTGVRDNDIQKDGMGMSTATAENPEDINIRLRRSSGYKVCDVSAIISVDTAVAGATTGRTGFLTGIKKGHVRVKKRF